ncbi:lectin c-type domain-containing protein [Ditylenchus destructor]|nr:lectin c-type domain-containing protein [Ditylenchus destructor]
MDLVLQFGPFCHGMGMDSMEAVDGEAIKDGYKFHQPVPSDQNNPWISGPSNKKYQFHVGQQSWLSARESCLSQNSDLVSIESEEELEWILSHYQPQFRHLRERQIQIGLLVDSDSRDASMREWRWVSRHPLDSVVQWTSGEPFDHAHGKERCAILNVNERRVDDVDCDLPGGPMHLFRFICERTHENHLKHEELNNPLWKKLEDILVFFGISEPSRTVNKTEQIQNKPVEDEEGYWDKQNAANITSKSHEEPKLPDNTDPVIQLIPNDPAPSTNSSGSEVNEALNIDEKQKEANDNNKAQKTTTENEGQKDTKIAPEKLSSSEESQSSEQSQKSESQKSDSAAESALNSATGNASEDNSWVVEQNSVNSTSSEQSPSHESPKNEQAEGEPTNTSDSDLLKSGDAPAEKPAPSSSNETSADGLNTVETAVLLGSENETLSDRKQQNPAVHGSKTLESSIIESDNAGGSANGLAEEKLEKLIGDAQQSAGESPQKLVEQAVPEPGISNDVLVVETASIETTRTTKADPLASLAETLERTFASASSDANNTESDQENKNSTQTQSRIHSLERIISAVQKMIEVHDHPATIEQPNDAPKTLDHSKLRRQLFFNDNALKARETKSKEEESKKFQNPSSESKAEINTTHVPTRSSRRRALFKPDAIPERYPSVFSDLFASLDAYPHSNFGRNPMNPPQDRPQHHPPKPAQRHHSSSEEDDFPEVMGRIANIYGKLFRFVMDDGNVHEHSSSVMRHMPTSDSSDVEVINPAQEAAKVIIQSEEAHSNTTTENVTETASSINSADKEEVGVESSLNVEADFVQADSENRSHPDINSGDLIVAPQHMHKHDVAGSCADDDDDHHNEVPESEIEADDSTGSESNTTLLQEKSAKIDKFIHSLRQFLDTAPPTQLKRLVDEGRTDKRPLIERLEEVVKMRQNARAQNKPIAEKAQESSVKSDPESPVEQLKKLHAERLEKQKQERIDKQLIDDLDMLKREESKEANDSALMDPKLNETLTQILEARQQSQSFVTGSALPEPEEEDDDTEIAKMKLRSDNTDHSKNESNLILQVSGPSEGINPDQALQKSSPSGSINTEPVLNQNLSPRRNSNDTVETQNTPTQEIIEAVLAMRTRPLSPANVPLPNNETVSADIPSAEKPRTSADAIRVSDDSPSAGANDTIQNEVQGNQPTIHNSVVEVEDPSSVFPRPNFSVLKPHELAHLPKQVEDRVKAERDRVDAAYKTFQQKLADNNKTDGIKTDLNASTLELIKRIQEADARRLTVKQSPAVEIQKLPLDKLEFGRDHLEHYDIATGEGQGIAIERDAWDGVFNTLGANFNRLIGRKRK